MGGVRAATACAEPGCPDVAVRDGRCTVHQRPKTRPGSTRRWREKVRPAVLERDGYRCQVCGAPAEHVDHIVRVCDGGTDDPANLRATCAACNLRRR